MALTLRQLRYFEALAEERNFARAAERVHISQPALSMQMRELEAVLGVQLVERLPREARLTPAGRDVLERGARILREVRELEALGRAAALEGRLQLGIIPTIAPYLLPRVLARLRATDITRDLRLREARTEQLIDELEAGTLDAVVLATSAGRARLVEVPLFEDQFVLAGSAARLRAMGQTEGLRPRALDPDQLLLLDEGHCLADQALEVCGLTRRVQRIDLGASSLSTLVGLVAEGFGLTLLPEIALLQEVKAAPKMALMRFADPAPARQVVLVRRAATPAEGWFSDLARILAEAGQGLVNAARKCAAPVKVDL
ncbi:MAG: LysR family transcriptional regulator [Cypionkella sp.]|nr:LysR family transcriptional regulator [Cypionkella sp.]